MRMSKRRDFLRQTLACLDDAGDRYYVVVPQSASGEGGNGRYRFHGFCRTKEPQKSTR